MTISEDKTKYMVCGPEAVAFQKGTKVLFDPFYFKVVDEFKYLGLYFDSVASSKHMVKYILDKAKRVFFWLLRFVTT